MSKNKSHKGLLKRIRVSKTGKIRHKSANFKHLRSHKSGKRLRKLRKGSFMASADSKRLEKLLFRRLRGRTQPRAAIRRSPSPAESKARKEAKAAEAALAAKPAAAKKAAAPKVASAKPAPAKAAKPAAEKSATATKSKKSAK